MTAPHSRPWHHSTKQYALLEFASLQQVCPQGIYLSLKPGNPAQWSGVLFVRKGPYSPAVLRFTITFPPDYPTLPPTITITTEIFHPLVAPLTTYTYTTRSLGTDTVSATDEERLPPGGFSLRHGFPCWFGRARKSIRSSAASSRNASISDDGNGQDAEDTNPPPKPKLRSVKRTSQASSSKESSTRDHHPMAPHSDKPIRIIAVLEYMKQAFEDEAALDTLPLDAAGNSGAWKAWRAHRKSTGEDAGLLLESAPKQHDDWNWDGVWEERVRKGIDASISEPTLYSGVGKGDDLIRFVDTDVETIQRVKAEVVGPGVLR